MPRPIRVIPELSERPPGFVGPDLSPQGLEPEPERLDDGVYALLATTPPKDNNGLVVGARAALVVDAGVTPDIGRQLQRLAARLTDRPIAYLANTTFHGDHTFGNAAFGDQVTVISSRPNKAAMDDLDREKRLRGESIHADPDTLVYVPDAKVAWTGNFLGRAGIPPMLVIGDPVTYLTSLRAMRDTLDVERLVPGRRLDARLPGAAAGGGQPAPGGRPAPGGDAGGDPAVGRHPAAAAPAPGPGR
jgi:cyclase